MSAKKITNSQKETVNRKITGLLVVFLGVIMIVGVSFLARFADLAVVRDKIKNKSVDKDKIVKISGTPACLPIKSQYKEEDNSNSNCQLGLKSDSGEYYALYGQNSLSLYGEIGASTFEIEGELIDAGKAEKYDISGTIIPK